MTRRPERTAVAERYFDCHNVAFDDVWRWIGDGPWTPGVEREELRDEYKSHLGFLSCFVCTGDWHELHHIVGGFTRGRADEYTNYMLLCSKCHRKFQSDKANFPYLLYRKWKVDRANTSWVRIAQLLGRNFDFELLTEPV